MTVGSLDTAAGLAPDHGRTTPASSVGGWSDDMIVIPQSPHTHTHTHTHTWLHGFSLLTTLRIEHACSPAHLVLWGDSAGGADGCNGGDELEERKSTHQLVHCHPLPPPPPPSLPYCSICLAVEGGSLESSDLPLTGVGTDIHTLTAQTVVGQLGLQTVEWNRVTWEEGQ